MPEWTSEQKQAIETRGTNILLSAAAGSGKTTVLVERVLQLVKAGTDIDRMLIVTFTRAASADMREKLTRDLSKLVETDPSLRKQLLLLEHASISTLHSFCSDFLRTNFEAAEVDPSFRLVQESEMSDMTDRALDRALEEAYTDPSPEMKLLNAGRGTAKVREMVRILLNALNEQPEPEEWLTRVCTQGPELRAAWAKELTDAALDAIRRAVTLLQLALDHEECNENYAPAITEDIIALSSILNTPDPDYDTLRTLLSDFKFTIAGRKRGIPKFGEIPKSYREKAKRIIDGLPIKSIALAPLLEDIENLTPSLLKLSEIALRAREIISDRKRAMGVLTYNDLEHFTIRALKNESIAQQMREQYEYVFVDEYQDTSNLQEYLVSRIVRDNNLFMVGDVKQSIYRFRQAEPSLFRGKYDNYASGNGGTLLHLTRNFRSCPAILDFVNCIFEKSMIGGKTEIVYDVNARLNHGNTSLTGGNVELHILKKMPTNTADIDPEDEELLEGSDSLQEAILVAKRIRELMEADPTLQFRDFAVLSRSGKGVLSKMAMALIAMGIDAYAEGAESYYESIEVRLAFSLLQLVKNRRSDIDLIGVLHSPIVGLTVDELARIRIADNGDSYSEAVRHYAQEHSDDLSLKINRFLSLLDAWQALSQNTDLGYFAHVLFSQSGLYNIARVLPASAQRIANIDRIVSDAEAFDRDISGSLTLFLNTLEHRRRNNEVGDVSTLSESDNVVRLMTIHKSKGLEYRVVFGVMLGHKIKKKETMAPLIIHRDLGLSCLYTDPVLRSRRKTLSTYAIDARTVNENYAEELRILYVMLTRAREQLILIGSDKDPEKLLTTVWSAASLDCYLYILLSALSKENNSYCTITAYSDYLRTAHAYEEPLDDEQNAPYDPDLTKAIGWKHIRSAQEELPLKLTVSGILRQIHAPYLRESFGDRPLFMMSSPGKLTGTERGTAYHRVLQCLDLASLKYIENERKLVSEIRKQMHDMRDVRRIRPVEHDAVDPSVIARFFLSETGKRILSSTEVRREWSFNARMNVADVLTLEERGHWGDGYIMVQGTVDACFREDDHWVLLDYKTDRENDHEALTARYADQLRMYAYALRSATGIPVSEIRLCLLSSNETLRIDP